MKKHQKAPERTETAQDVKTISPETWARLRPLARRLLVEIAELLANDNPPERVQAAIYKDRYGDACELGVDGGPGHFTIAA